MRAPGKRPGPVPPAAMAVTSRVVAAVLGGYAFSAAAAALLAVALWAGLGLTRADAALAASMPAFLVYLGAAVWAFAAPNPLRPLAVLFGVAAAMLLAAESVMRLG